MSDWSDVQIKMIETAEKLVGSPSRQSGLTDEQWIEQKAKWLDQAYKAIFKTVSNPK